MLYKMEGILDLKPNYQLQDYTRLVFIFLYLLKFAKFACVFRNEKKIVFLTCHHIQHG